MSSMSGIVSAVEMQIRVMYGISVRNIQSKTRESPLGAFSSLLEPLGQILLVSMVFTFIRVRVPGIGDYLILVLVTGIVPLSLFRMGNMSGIRVLSQQRNALVFRHVRPLDLVLGGILTEFLIMLALFFLITMFFLLIYQADVLQDPVICVAAFGCMAILALGFCCVNIVIISWFPFWQKVFAILTGPLPLISGMFYTAESLPVKAQKILYWNPFMHGTEFLRTYYYPEFTSGFFDPYYFFGWVIGSLVVGLACEWTFRQRLSAAK